MGVVQRQICLLIADVLNHSEQELTPETTVVTPQFV